MRITALVVLVASSLSASVADDRPNILFAVADDWSWPHAGAYGDRVARTPTFDRLAAEGALFTRAFCASPSCTPSRGAILTGQAPHRLEAGGNLWSALPRKFAVYPDLLEAEGYVVGLTGKGWGPGDHEAGGWTRNPAGPRFKGFAEFLETVPADRPFCYWFGSTDPHRPYDRGSGASSGLKPDEVAVPPFLPDVPEVRDDLLDYAFEVGRFDRQVGDILAALEQSGRAANTIVVMTSDNGMPFPRAKANLYDAGTHVPLAIRWPAKVAAGQRIGAFANLTDLAPTFLDAGGIEPPAWMTGRSLLPVLLGAEPEGRDAEFLERERHANVRRGDLSYPGRAIRTGDFLYIRNLRPTRWPAGDPDLYFAVGAYGDVDGSPTKDWMLDLSHGDSRRFNQAFSRRPAEELYDLNVDPWELHNVAGRADYADALNRLRSRLETWMRRTDDPRVNPDVDPWDLYRYYGGPVRP